MRKLLIILVLAVLAAGCTRIGPGYVGIKVSNAGSDRGVSQDALTTGWVFYTPGASTVFEYPTFVQQVVLTKNPNEGGATNDEITFTNSDQMTIAADISFAYHLEREKVPAFYEKFRSDDLTTFTQKASGIAYSCAGRIHQDSEVEWRTASVHWRRYPAYRSTRS